MRAAVVWVVLAGCAATSAGKDAETSADTGAPPDGTPPPGVPCADRDDPLCLEELPATAVRSLGWDCDGRLVADWEGVADGQPLRVIVALVCDVGGACGSGEYTVSCAPGEVPFTFEPRATDGVRVWECPFDAGTADPTGRVALESRGDRSYGGTMTGFSVSGPAAPPVTVRRAAFDGVPVDDCQD